MEVLVKHGADVNKTDHYGATPLYTAVENGQKDAVKFLLEHGAGADFNELIDLAEENGHSEVVKILQEAAAERET